MTNTEKRINRDHERWIMSFYRSSEITGALFFGRIAGYLPAGPIQSDLTHHFADESMHACYWTKAMDECGYQPERIKDAYQDAYLDAVGLPVNMMEILAITSVFEHRVIAQYAKHLRVPNLNPYIANTIETIMEDEKWHIKWIGDALKQMESEYGKDTIKSTLKRYQKADKEIYHKLVSENQERLDFILKKPEKIA